MEDDGGVIVTIRVFSAYCGSSKQGKNSHDGIRFQEGLRDGFYLTAF